MPPCLRASVPSEARSPSSSCSSWSASSRFWSASCFPPWRSAREQARYVRWQGFSHNLQSDPDVCLYYNFQNDLGNNVVSNMALSSPALTDPTHLAGQLSYPVAGPADAAAAHRFSAIGTLLVATGSFPRQARHHLPVRGPNTTLILPKEMTGVANLLQTSQQISIAYWIAGTPSGGQAPALFWWPAVNPAKPNRHLLHVQ